MSDSFAPGASAPGFAPGNTVGRRPLGSLTFAAFAAIAAGAIHAAAVGVHSEHRQASLTFVAVAAFQLGWGAWALTRSNRLAATIGLVGNVGLFAGWLLAKTSGITFIEGLDTSESAQFADTAAAVFALIAVLAIASRLLDRRPEARSIPMPMLAMLGAVVAAVAVPAMASAGTHRHAETETDGAAHGHEAEATPTGDASTATTAHDQTHDTAHTDHTDAPADPSQAPTTEHQHSDTTGAGSPDTVPHAEHAAPKPYDPTMPIDLSGTPGVTPQQQAQAENLISATLLGLPKFADYNALEALGWHSIGDGGTGYEHYVNWKLINDDVFLDPNQPESLVFTIDESTGEKQLASAMFMMPTSYTLETVPELGGPLTQWHIHNNLCYSDDPNKNPQVRVVGLTDGDGNCRFGFKPEEAPMIHVWIVPHKCGPFSALEGVGAGQVKEGETTMCDAAHGSH